MQVRDPELLRRARERRGYTQRDLAALCRCSQGAISSIERGRLSRITEDLGREIARRLDRDVEDLFDTKHVSTVHRVTTGAPTSHRVKRKAAA